VIARESGGATWVPSSSSEREVVKSITPKTILLVAAGDAAILVAVLGLVGFYQLSTVAGIALLTFGISLSAVGVLQIVRGARPRDGAMDRLTEGDERD